MVALGALAASSSGLRGVLQERRLSAAYAALAGSNEIEQLTFFLTSLTEVFHRSESLVTSSYRSDSFIPETGPSRAKPIVPSWTPSSTSSSPSVISSSFPSSSSIVRSST